MTALAIHPFHHGLGARFTSMAGMEAVADYGDWRAEHTALREHVGVLDLSFRGRLCFVGPDRQRFLNGQVTNNVKDLRPGQGCYAALVTAKGKMVSDLNLYCLEEEFLADFEPGLSASLTKRFDQFIIADDVQVVDASPHFGLLSVQGPGAERVVAALGLEWKAPSTPQHIAAVHDRALGTLYCANVARCGSSGYDLFVPVAALAAVADRLVAGAHQEGGRACGWQALEAARIEAAIPRFGADMDDTNLPPEAGLEARAISYSKGCYIGQEVIARIRTYGQVAKTLQCLALPADLAEMPAKGDKLFHGGKEAGYITSALASPAFNAHIALGYVRRECHQTGTELVCHTAQGECAARVVPRPFSAETLRASEVAATR